ncbi:alpha-L-fucosidase [Planoprotostelium fungivorum]|uniref:Alpha-L-fucosidase n=1 Tax=Planoprotostelium fungivorum TaxID=1890364 RepID=A0A2P6NGK1_9EUKA|nr:alpha-L-fucosidase [Planoprotostelium fungivorum]
MCPFMFDAFNSGFSTIPLWLLITLFGAAMRGIALLALVTLAFGYDLSNKNVIWSDGLSGHISLTAVTPQPSGFSIFPANLSSCAGSDACDPNNTSPYWTNEGVPVNSTWMINFDDGTWIELCICQGYVMDQNAMARALSYVPPSVRSSVNRVTQKPTGNGAVTIGNSAIYKGQYLAEVFVHESAHSFDYSNGISGQNVWQNAIGNDTCVPDPYARTNEVEDWAQTSVLYWFLSYSNASDDILQNGTFRCWSRSRQVASLYMPHNVSREFDSRERVTIVPKTSEGRLNYIDTRVVTNSTNSGGWQLVPSSFNYYLICESGGGTMSCLDALGQTHSDNSPYIYHPRNGGFNQQWSLLPDGRGHHKIINRANGLALKNFGCGSASASTNVVFAADGTDDCLLWKIVRPTAATATATATATAATGTQSSASSSSTSVVQSTSEATGIQMTAGALFCVLVVVLNAF